jgi:hypothetical protein
MKSKAICVLGMHRSGTSTITRSVNFLGAYIGEEKDMVPPGFDNPEGFWELRDIVSLHNRMLSALKRNYDTVAPLPEQWQLRREMLPFREELRDLIRRYFTSHPFWAWKDPRTCLTFTLWKELLDELGIDLSVIFVVRNPCDVANSLKQRNSFSFDKSFGIWFNHNISALESTAGVSTVFLSYDRFLEGWEQEMRRCASAFDIPWLDDEQLRQNMTSFVRPELRHNKSTVEDLQGLPIPVRELYNLLLQLTTGAIGPDNSFLKAIGTLSREFRNYASFFCSDLEFSLERANWLAGQTKYLENQKMQLRDKEERIAECERHLAEKDLQLTECRRQLQEAQNQLQKLSSSGR